MSLGTRSLRTLLLGLGVSVLLGCQPNVFTTTQKGQTTLPGSPSGSAFTAFPQIGSFSSIDFSQNQDFKSLGISKSQVTSVKVTDARVRILSPATQDFSFLDKLAFSARAGDTEELVADKHDISSLDLAAPNPTLKLDVKAVELQPFLAAPTMSIVVSGSGRSPPQDTRVEADITFQVTFNLLQ